LAWVNKPELLAKKLRLKGGWDFLLGKRLGNERIATIRGGEERLGVLHERGAAKNGDAG